jgi:hypothetical protein
MNEDTKAIDITKAKAITLEEAAFGHLFLCWIDNAPYYAIRVSGGLLCFDAPTLAGPQGDIAVVVRYERDNSSLCLGIGVAIVRWCNKAVALGGAASPGDIIVDQTGVSILGREAGSKGFATGQDRRAWRLSNGELRGDCPAWLVIRDWEIGVRGEDQNFIRFAPSLCN